MKPLFESKALKIISQVVRETNKAFIDLGYAFALVASRSKELHKNSPCTFRTQPKKEDLE